MTDAEPRVRANIIEGLSEAEFNRTELCDFFLLFVEDPNNRVVANALLRLYRMGSVDVAKSRLMEMARHENGEFRASAAWVMGQTEDCGFHGSLKILRADAERA